MTARRHIAQTQGGHGSDHSFEGNPAWGSAGVWGDGYVQVATTVRDSTESAWWVAGAPPRAYPTRDTLVSAARFWAQQEAQDA